MASMRKPAGNCKNCGKPIELLVYKGGECYTHVRLKDGSKCIKTVPESFGKITE